MNQIDQSELAAFILRVTLGVMYLTHSFVLKLMTFTLAGTATFYLVPVTTSVSRFMPKLPKPNTRPSTVTRMARH